MPRSRQRICMLVAVLSFLSLLPSSHSQDALFCPLYNFGPQAGDPLWPQTPGRIAAPGDGWLYSTSNNGGGPWSRGAIFKISPVGELTVIWGFDGRHTGSGPQGGLTDGKDGYLYGTTWGGGNFGAGTIFRIPYGADSGTRPAILFHFRNGSVQGLAPDPCPTAPRCPYSPRQRADISSGFPISAPVMGSDGNLHGVTGYSNNQQYGTVYSIPATGGEENFHVACIFQPALLNDKDMKDFVCNSDPKIGNPAVLIAGNDGRLYGTTFAGYGGVFRVEGNKVTTLHEFQLKDGSKPIDLMQGSDGYLYGTTMAGGDANWGVIYRIDPGYGSFKVLYHFQPSQYPAGTQGVPPWAGAPGSVPAAGLVEGRGGYLYGVAKYGGRWGRGVIFRIGTSGNGYEVLHEFNSKDGRTPSTTPVIVHYQLYKDNQRVDVTSGDLFGMTYQGGWNAKTNNISDGGVFYRLSVDQPTITGVGSLPRCPTQPSPSTDGPCLLVDDSVVQVSAHVTVKQPGQLAPNDPLEPWRPPQPVPEIDDAISVQLNCADRPHIVQFIYREKIGPDGPYHGSVASTTGTYLLTIDPNRPCWNPDSLSKPSFYVRKRNPYYDQGRQARWGCSGVTIFDNPSFAPPLFNDNQNEIWRATARDYLICAGKVQKQVQWVVEEKYGGPRTYSATIQNASEIPDAFLGLLANQDFLLPFPLENPMLPTQTGPACAQ